MKFNRSFKELLNKKSQPPALVSRMTEPIPEVPQGIFGTYNDSRLSSTTSLRSNSSKKLAWILGPDSVAQATNNARPPYSRSNSAAKARQLLGPDCPRHSDNWPLTGQEASADESDDESFMADLVDSYDEPSKTQEFADVDLIKPTVVSVQRADLDSPPTSIALAKMVEASSVAPDSPDVDALSIAQFADFQLTRHTPEEERYITEPVAPTKELSPLEIAPDSPDVDSLSVPHFAPFTSTSSQCSSPRYQGDSSPEDAIDFNEVCERLLDSLSAPLVRPSLGRYSNASSASSSKSSTMLYTEPASPQSFSSASSFESLAKEEKLEKAKSALVADQAALDAKLKLAAARDALKRVRNVASPQAKDTPRPVILRGYTATGRAAGHSRTSSETPTLALQPQMRHSRSSSAVNDLTQERPIRSSRSSRMLRDDNEPLSTQKSSIRIGIAAPKDLSVLKKAGDKAGHAKKPSAQVKTKGKAALYVPQNHITSIHEVLA